MTEPYTPYETITVTLNRWVALQEDFEKHKKQLEHTIAVNNSLIKAIEAKGFSVTIQEFEVTIKK